MNGVTPKALKEAGFLPISQTLACADIRTFAPRALLSHLPTDDTLRR